MLQNLNGQSNHKRRGAEEAAEAALAVVRALGVRVFPCAPRRLGNAKAKTPLVKNWSHVATSDAAQIRAWWSKWPDALIGVPTGSASGFFVADKDVKDGKNGIHDMHRLEEANGRLPQTPQAQTPTGGEHDYYRMPDEEIRNSVGVIAPGIDIRGDGGYVIVPPSALPDGSLYRWLREPSERIEFA